MWTELRLLCQKTNFSLGLSVFPSPPQKNNTFELWLCSRVIIAQCDWLPRDPNYSKENPCNQVWFDNPIHGVIKTGVLEVLSEDRYNSTNPLSRNEMQANHLSLYSCCFYKGVIMYPITKSASNKSILSHCTLCQVRLIKPNNELGQYSRFWNGTNLIELGEPI